VNGTTQDDTGQLSSPGTNFTLTGSIKNGKLVGTTSIPAAGTVIKGNLTLAKGGVTIGGTTGGLMGACSVDADCYAFGERHCGSSILKSGEFARCGSDKWCHCCVTMQPSTLEGKPVGNPYCLDCQYCGGWSAGGSHCERDICIFNVGGKTTD
jgi:hypothetical protein